MEDRVNMRPVLTGIMTIVVILFMVSLTLSLILHFTSFKESTLEWLLLPITLVTLFIGGAIAGFRSGTKGWYIGMLTGIGFIFLTWLISFLGFETSLSLSTIWLYAAYLAMTIIGGIVGVNISPRRGK
jgi:putative membrane protein (TIGR04086 family)